MKLNNITAIVLGAGKGTRMKSDKPKVMHEIGHWPMVMHVHHLLEGLGCYKKVFVSSPDMEDVRERLDTFSHAIQDQAFGTGHAVLSASSHIDGTKDILVLFGDTPLVTPATIKKMVEARKRYDLVVLGMHPKDPGHYGRLIMDDAGWLTRIVEYKDASATERNITFCNSGIMLINGVYALDLLKKITNKNANGEFYLTDIVEIANVQGIRSTAVAGEEEELIGVNSCADLAKAELLFQGHQRQKFMEQGVALQDPETTYFSFDTRIDAGTTIEPNVYFGSGVVVGKNVTIKANSYLEGCVIKSNSSVGPFARLRPGAELQENVKVGNFVEIKKSKIGKGSKVSHLSYIGDSTLGKDVNIGAGTITCNYDGYGKYETTIKDGVFVGSNSSLVAPLTIGKDAIVGAGSTLTKDVSKDEIALTRAEQKNLKGGARRFRSQKESN